MYDALWNYFQDNGYQPHGFCLTWRADVFWTHVASDTLIALSYFTIPIALWRLAKLRPDFGYRWVLHLFSLFIIACGATHTFGVWTMWVPSYGAEGAAKAATAAVSMATAVMIWPLLPRIAALPSPAQLEEQNRRLQAEIVDRKAAEARLAALNAELERRVAGRTQVLEKTNAELLQASAAAEQSGRAKADFLATMSHEIRTPMNGVIGMIELLKKQGLDDGQRRYADTAAESARALLQILNDVLDFSKIESGAFTIESAPFDPAALMGDVARLVSPAARDKGLAVALSTPGENGQPVLGDAARLRQVLLNLAANAVKFTESGSVRFGLTRETGPDGAVVLRFAVEDTGIGIPQSVQERLFTRFTQADGSISRRFGGSGLGLAISKQLVTLMGGEIGVRSAPGRGSLFWVALPCRPAPAQSDASAAPEAVAVPPGLEALVVDDNEVNRIVAQELLCDAGVAVTLACDGAEAVGRAAGRRFDVILMDVSMPVMDGLEATRRIRAGGGPCADAPIVALTASVMGDDTARHRAAGMTAHLGKPFTPDALIATVARMAREHGAARPRLALPSAGGPA